MSSSTESPGDRAIKVGYVRRAHGIKGAVVVRVLGDMPEQFVVGATLATDSSDHPVLTVQSNRRHNDGLLIAFEGVSDRNVAESLRGVSFLIQSEDRRGLDEDEFWPDDLIGLSAANPDGQTIGVVVDVTSGAAQDRLTIETEGGAVEVPFVAAIVTEVDLESRVVVIDAPVGLF